MDKFNVYIIIISLSAGCTLQEQSISTGTTEIRLTNSPADNKNSGLLEIRHNDVWGTACGANFNASAAKVVCNMLKLPSGAAFGYYFHSDFIKGTPNTTWLTKVACSGTESDLAECDLSPWGGDGGRCLHYWDVGVECTNKQITDIRLSGGLSDHEGRVEVLYDGVWGSICDQEFTDAAATVACRMLNITTDYAERLPRSYKLSTVAPKKVWMRQVQCTGREPTLSVCRHHRMGDDFCGHLSDVRINCFAEKPFYRLAAGNTSFGGRLEVYHNATWGTVCDDGWRNGSAQVICAMLGYQRPGAIARMRGYFGAGSDPIWLDQLQCEGFEHSVTECTRFPWGYAHCSHKEDAGVSCSEESLPDNFVLFTDADQKQIVRIDLTSEMYVAIPSLTLVEPVDVEYDPVEGRIYWTDSGLQEIKSAHVSGRGETIVRKFNNDTLLGSLVLDPVSRVIFYVTMQHDGIARMSTDGSDHMPVIGPGSFTAGDIALDTSNRLLYYTNQSQIARVTYDGADRKVLVDSGIYLAVALTVDDQNGVVYWMDSFKRTIEAVSTDGTHRRTVYKNTVSVYTDMGILGDQLFYSDLSESALVSMSVVGGTKQQIGPPTFSNIHGLHVYKSGHGSARNVITDIRLINGSSPKYGMLEVKVKGQWRGVCADSVNRASAEVLCRSLGYDKYGLPQDAVRFVNYHGPDNKFYVLPYFNCTGNESKITGCDASPHFNNICHSNRDVIIDCAPSLQEIIQLQCSTSGWHVEIDLDKLNYRYPGTRQTYIYLGDNRCTGIAQGTMLVFDESFDNCLTEQKFIKDGTLYANQLIYANRDPSHPTVIRTFNWTVKLTCTNQNESSTGHVTPFNQSTIVNVHTNTSSTYHLVTEFFSDPNFLQSISGEPLTVAEGSLVYVKVYVPQADWTIKMKVVTCYTTSSNGDQIKDYFLIKQGCEVDANTHYIAETMHETRFVFQLFEKTTSRDHVFLHCEAIYCDTSQSTSLQVCDDQCIT